MSVLYFCKTSNAYSDFVSITNLVLFDSLKLEVGDWLSQQQKKVENFH